MNGRQLERTSSTEAGSRGTRLSVVVPVYNEDAVLPEFHRRLTAVLDDEEIDLEVIYVNDGSTDATLAFLKDLYEVDARVAFVDLSRNFGKEIALTAGLDQASGDAVVVIDADLQDPPELIPELLKHWRDGYDVVYAQRISRTGESMLKRATASAFYRLMKNVGRVGMPADTGDFRLLSRRALDALSQLREHHRFMKGLFAWIGYRQIAVPYRRAPRAAGTTKWNYWRLWNFSIEGITSFTIAPLKAATYTGLASALFAFVCGIVVIYRTIAYGDPVQGWPSLMVVILFFSGVQLTTMGILGEYLGRVFNETKRRPLYLVSEVMPPRRFGGALDSLRSATQVESQVSARQLHVS